MRTLFVAFASGLVLVGPSTAQTVTAAFHQYGKACSHTIGSNLGLAAPALKTQVLTNEYCFGFKAPNAITVLGFSLFTQTTSPTSAPVTMECGFYRAAGTAPSTTLVG